MQTLPAIFWSRSIFWAKEKCDYLANCYENGFQSLQSEICDVSMRCELHWQIANGMINSVGDLRAILALPIGLPKDPAQNDLWVLNKSRKANLGVCETMRG